MSLRPKLRQDLVLVEQSYRGEQSFIVKDPDIPLSQVEAVQQEVFVLLENNGRSPEPPQDTPAEAQSPPAEDVSPEETPASEPSPELDER